MSEDLEQHPIAGMLAPNLCRVLMALLVALTANVAVGGVPAACSHRPLPAHSWAAAAGWHRSCLFAEICA